MSLLKKYSLGLACLLAVAGGAHAQEFPASAIPDSLRKDADYVVRLFQQELKIESEGEGVLKVRNVTTILKMRGNDEALVGITYDDFSRVQSARIRVLDAEGRVIQESKLSEMKDISTASHSTVATSTRVKALDLRRGRFPYTVDLEYQQRFSQTLSLPRWQQLPEAGAALEKGMLTVTNPKGLTYRHKEYRGATPSTVSLVGGNEVRVWTADGLKATEDKPYTEIYSDQVPTVDLAPNSFQLGRAVGFFNSWDDLGKWYYQLNQETRELPDADLELAKKIGAGTGTQRQKLAQLYQHLQSRFRYTGIQKGLGGLKSMPARHVAASGFGDCKGLTNYMQAMAEAAGIPCQAVLVYAGPEAMGLDPAFPAQHFNHVVLMAPIGRDTVFLECTSQTDPFGYMSTGHSGNRPGLALHSSGARIVWIPGSDDNRIVRVLDMKMGEDGSGEGKIQSWSTGCFFESMQPLAAADQYEQQEVLQDWLDVGGGTLGQTQVQSEAGSPTIKLTSGLRLAAFGQRAGKSFLLPKPFVFASQFGFFDSTRTREMIVRTPVVYLDTIRLALGAGYVLPKAPEPFDQKHKGMTLKARIEPAEGGKVLLISEARLDKGRFSPADYRQMALAVARHKAYTRKALVLTKT